jgi:hypothetical protein
MSSQSNQAVQIAAIVGIVVIVLALIAATVFAPGSGVNNLLTLIGGVVTVLLGLAKLQSVGNQIAAVSTKADTTAANVARVEEKMDVVHDKVNGLNVAALANQQIVSEAVGFDKGLAASAQVAAANVAAQDATAAQPPLVDAPNPRYQPPGRKE